VRRGSSSRKSIARLTASQPGIGRFCAPEGFAISQNSAAPRSWLRPPQCRSSLLREHECAQLLADFRRIAETSFLVGYVEGRGAPPTVAERALIVAFTIEKAAYEICYEIANRPDWIDVPLNGLVSSLTAIPAESAEPAYG
jgi:predicted trehalose synthase